MRNFEKNRKLILSKLEIGEKDFLGKGVESFVYGYGENQVVRILKEGNPKYLRSLRELQESISRSDLPVKTSLITDVGELNGTTYTVERRMEGQNLSKIFDTYSSEQKETVLRQYFDLPIELTKVDVEGFEFGQMVDTKDKVSANGWQTFLLKKVKQKTDLVREQLEKDVLGFEGKLGVFTRLVDTKLGGVEKNLVHGDYFYDNVMANREARITGILDFSGWTTVVGDFRLDVAGSIIFLEHSEKFINYQKVLTRIAKERYGKDIEWFIDFYRIYYSLFLSDSYLYLRPLYDWCVKNLNDENLWRRVG